MKEEKTSDKIHRLPTTPRMEELLRERDQFALDTIDKLRDHPNRASKARKLNRILVQKQYQVNEINELASILDRCRTEPDYFITPSYLYEIAAQWLRLRGVSVPDDPLDASKT